MLQTEGSQEHGWSKADLQTTGSQLLIEHAKSDEGSEAASCLQVRLLAGYKLGSQNDVPWLATELKCCTWADGCQPEQQVAEGVQGSTCSNAITVHHIWAELMCAARCAQNVTSSTSNQAANLWGEDCMDALCCSRAACCHVGQELGTSLQQVWPTCNTQQKECSDNGKSCEPAGDRKRTRQGCMTLQQCQGAGGQPLLRQRLTYMRTCCTQVAQGPQQLQQIWINGAMLFAGISGLGQLAREPLRAVLLHQSQPPTFTACQAENLLKACERLVAGHE